MNLARTIRFDASDLNIFPVAAEEGEWAVTGSFTFQHLREDQITGKVRQAFANGFLGVESFGYSTFVAVASASPEARAALRDQLIRRFVEDMGAPSEEAAGHAADEEISFMIDLCSGHKPGTLLVVQREWAEDGIRESFRHMPKPDSCAEQSIWTIVEDDQDTTESKDIS